MQKDQIYIYSLKQVIGFQEKLTQKFIDKQPQTDLFKCLDEGIDKIIDQSRIEEADQTTFTIPDKTMIDVQLKHIIDNQYSEMSYKKVPMTENCTDMSIDFPKDITSFDISR